MDRLHDYIMCRLLALLYICGNLAFCSFEGSFVIRCCELPFSPLKNILAGPLDLNDITDVADAPNGSYVNGIVGKKNKSLIACKIAE